MCGVGGCACGEGAHAREHQRQWVEAHGALPTRAASVGARAHLLALELEHRDERPHGARTHDRAADAHEPADTIGAERGD